MCTPQARQSAEGLGGVHAGACWMRGCALARATRKGKPGADVMCEYTRFALMAVHSAQLHTVPTAWCPQTRHSRCSPRLGLPGLRLLAAGAFACT